MTAKVEIIEVEMPLGNNILCAQYKDKEICLWTLGDPDEIKYIAKFFFAETGKPFPDYKVVSYIDSIQVGKWIAHLFRVDKE